MLFLLIHFEFLFFRVNPLIEQQVSISASLEETAICSIKLIKNRRGEVSPVIMVSSETFSLQVLEVKLPNIGVIEL